MQSSGNNVETIMFYYFRNFMILCDLCGEWFHLECVELKKENLLKKDAKYFCPDCSQFTFPDMFQVIILYMYSYVTRMLAILNSKLQLNLMYNTIVYLLRY